MKKGNKVTAYKYNKNDELLRTDTLNTGTEEDSIVIYKYDKNGNQLATVNRYEIPADRKDSTYIDIDVTLGDNRLNENVVNHYNALNQLTQMLTRNYKVSFTYDAAGLRTSKTVNGEKTVFVWDGDQLVLELSESGKVQKRYVRGNDLVYADKRTGTDKQFYVTDSHGNVVQLTDENGKVTKTYEYDSFGNEVKPDSKDDNPFRYCGEYYDKETEEIYLRARYYQPVVGRFLTRDTYMGKEDDVLSLHLYAYCGNDAINRIDPEGHDSYVFTINEFKRESKGIKKIVKRYYKKKVHLIITDLNKEFKKRWNKMKGKIESVVINSHADPTALSFASVDDVLSLKKKNVKKLVLLGCNAGHSDYNFMNIAYYFRKKINGPCIASDGTVWSGPDCTNESDFDSIGDKYWRDWRDEAQSSRKKNDGWLMYENSKVISYFSKRKVKLKKLLTF